MLKKIITFVFLSFSCAYSAFADDLQKQRAFIGQLNLKLDQWASASGMKVSYSDIVSVTDPFYEEYLSFKSPNVIVINQGVEYSFTAPSIAIVREDENALKLNLPTHISLTVRAVGAGPSAAKGQYEIALAGLPEILFKTNSGQQLSQIRFNSPQLIFGQGGTAVKMKVRRVIEEDGRTELISQGSAIYEKLPVTYDKWHSIKPLEPQALAAFVQSIRPIALP